MAAVAVLVPLLALAGCVVDDAAEVQTRLDGDRLLAAGDFVNAARAYERQLRASPGSPALEENLRTARLRGAQQSADEALAAAARGDAANASTAIATAERLAPNSPYVRRVRAEIDGVLVGDARANELRAEGRAAMRDDPERAAEAFAEARGLSRAGAADVGLLRDATLRSEAVRAARRAGLAWDAGERDRALRELATAAVAGRPVPDAEALRDVIAFDLLAEAREGDLVTASDAYAMAAAAGLPTRSARAIRSAYTDRLIAERDALLRTGRPALAALHEITAERAGATPGTRARAAAADSARLVVVVPPFRDETGRADADAPAAGTGDDTGVRAARAIAGRLNADARGGGLVVVALGPDEASQFAAHPAALRLTGVLTAARVATGPRSPSTIQVDTVVGTQRSENPESAAAMERLATARADLAAADEAIVKANAEMRRLRASPFVGGGMSSAALDKALARQQLEMQALVERRDELAAAELAARRDVARTPPSAEVPVLEPRAVAVASFRRVASVTARVALTDAATTLLEESVTGSAMHDERVHEGAPGSGGTGTGDLAADPDDSPDAAGMSDLAVDHLARLVAGRVRTVAAGAAERFLLAADRARAAGRTGDAAEGYSLYLLVTPESASQGRERAARALRETAGFDPAVRGGGARRRP